MLSNQLIAYNIIIKKKVIYVCVYMYTVCIYTRTYLQTLRLITINQFDSNLCKTAVKLINLTKLKFVVCVCVCITYICIYTHIFCCYS